LISDNEQLLKQHANGHVLNSLSDLNEFGEANESLFQKFSSILQILKMASLSFCQYPSANMTTDYLKLISAIDIRDGHFPNTERSHWGGD
jgi:hypothetical protein